MAYVVLDLEWNQAMSSRSSIFNKLPIRLRGEIIQIGAVRLTNDFRPAEEFQSYVKPVYFRRMHTRVKKLTGIDKERLSPADGFAEVYRQFHEWCGDDCTFLTWGCDDRDIMEQNIIIHDLDWDWISGWINLQLIYNLQTGGDRNQKALKTAMEHFEIEQTRSAHDALGDAYNTALVCERLDMQAGIKAYSTATVELDRRSAESASAELTPIPVSSDSFSGYSQRSEAFSDERVTVAPCPDCGKPMSAHRWLNQGDKRYMTLTECPEHGKFLVRIRFKKGEDMRWAVGRLIYRADEDMEKHFKLKAIQNKRRGRRGGKIKTKKASLSSAEASSAAE